MVKLPAHMGFRKAEFFIYKHDISYTYNRARHDNYTYVMCYSGFSNKSERRYVMDDFGNLANV